ncbi:diphthine--ammonia ligase [Fluviicola sp.]|uniref:Dph6-related ATP pyrophosphatase n=1 Tax=Fluviicola sp. TaxID=1917219 RepID=UPI0031D1755B
MKEKAIVLWSGGKDCNLALHLAKEEGYEITALVTFYSKSTEFRAHPKTWMDLQSRSLGIPHLLLEIEEPFAANYEIQLRKLKNQLGISRVVSGDISEVHGNTNWVSDRAAAAGLNVFLPLWHRKREEVMDLLLKSHFEVVLTLVKSPWLNESVVGRTINPELIETFKLLGKENGLDLCGEKGEYHTMAVNGPGYRSRVSLNKYEVVQHEEMSHMTKIELSLDGDYEVPALEKHKICVTCGIPFSCYTQGCWCAELPMIMPMENITDCMCPVCLKAAIDKRLGQIHK